MTKRTHVHTHTHARACNTQMNVHTTIQIQPSTLACIHYTGVAETYKRNRRIPKLLLNRFCANITRGDSRCRVVTVQVEDERRTRRDPGRRGKGATWGLNGRKEWDGGTGTGKGGEGEIGAERRRQESRELASPSANFITELVVFAQIISIYSTQAGNLFASECMREWNLPPRSRLVRARALAHMCVSCCRGARTDG